MRLPNETEEQVLLIGGVLLILYFVGGQILAALQKALTFAAGQPQRLGDNIEIPGTGQTAGALRAIGWTDADINAMWGQAVAEASPLLDPGQYNVFVAP
jgi:hypothetical protein